MRHRVTELTKNESTHKEENHCPAMEGAMTHGVRLAARLPPRNQNP